ncbi:MAG: glycosyltransferase family 39 protein [Phototrophicaceae bacterium]
MTNQSVKNDIRIDELPTWMRIALQPYDYGFILVGVVGVLVGWFFVVGPQLPNGLEITHYAFLMEDYAQSLREGQLYPRWAAHANSGYGSPIPQFIPPFVPYSMAVLRLLSNQSTEWVIRFYVLFVFVLGGIGTYGYVRQAFHAKAAFLASVLFLTSPIFGHELPHVIGEVTILTVMSEFVLFQWVLMRWLRLQGTLNRTLLFLLLGGMILTHPPTACLAIVSGYLICWGYGWWEGNWRSPMLGYTFIVGIGLGISTCYWLPALGGMRSVQFTRFDATLPNFYTTFRTLIEPHYPVSSAIQTPPIRLSVGGLRAVLGLMGWVWVYRQQRLGLPHYLSGLLLVFTLVLNLTIFHQSLILPTLLTWYVCIVGSWVVDKYPTPANPYTRVGLVALCTLTLVASRASWLPPDPQINSIRSYTPLAQLQHELNGRGVAVLPSIYPYPRLPSPQVGNNAYWFSYTRNMPDRLSSNQASVLVAKNHESVWQITNSAETRIQILQSNFRGWRATLDEAPLSITTHPESGLIQVIVPPSINGRLQVKLGNTVLHGLGITISGMMLFIALMLPPPTAPSTYEILDGMGIHEARLVGGMLGWFTVIIVMSASPNARWSLRPNQVLPLDSFVTVQARTQTGIALVGYSIEETRVYPTERLPFTLVWTTLRPLETNYQVQISLLNEQQQAFHFEQPLRYPSAVPPNMWQVNRLVYDHHTMQLPPKLPNGSYQIVLRLQPCHYAKQQCAVTTTLLPMFFADFGQPIGEELILPSWIEVSQ